MSSPRIVLTTGGTGGHIFPALAVAEELRNQGAELLFIGGDYGPEADLAAKAGLAFKSLPARGLVGRGLKSVPAVAKLAVSVVKALVMLRKFKPQAVGGFGGYASFSPVVAAKVLGIPSVLHEQNSVPGVATRTLARFAQKVCVSFPDTGGVLPAAKVVRTGNPVRRGIRELGQQRTKNTNGGRNLLVLGGSQGATPLNKAIMRDMQALKDMGVSIWHQTGQADFEMVKAVYGRLADTGTRVEPFIHDMAAAYAWADVVLCRAGATTLAELAVAGLPSVLVPFPLAAHDHQTKNAQAMADAGAAVLLPQAKLEDVALDNVLRPVFDPRELADMGKAATSLGKPDAAALVAREILNFCGATA